MKYTLGYILDHKFNCKYAPNIDPAIQDAVAAAFWAGEAKARADEREANRQAKKLVPRGRYHKMIENSLSFFNVQSVEGLRDESANIMSWDFEFKK